MVWRELGTLGARILEIGGLLPEEACGELLARAEEAGFRRARQAAQGRVNEEAFLVLPEESRRIGERLSACIRVAAVGPAVEVYRYSEGEHVTPHRDSARTMDDGTRSVYSLLVFLTDGFDGGETHFLDSGLAVRPSKGGALLFDQRLLHEGRPVLRGTKCIARLDVSER